MPRPSDRIYIPSAWKQWIAENVLRGGTEADLVPILVQEGFSEELARLEVDAAITHPYLAAAASLARQKQKSDWVFHTLRRLRMLQPGDEIPRLQSIAGEEFLRSFYCRNQPLVLNGAIEGWPALERWNAAYLIEKAGDRNVEIRSIPASSNGGQTGARPYQARFTDFVRTVFRGPESAHLYMVADCRGINAAVLDLLAPDIGGLSELLDPTLAASARFLSIGSAGTPTAVQHDVKNQLIAQIVGHRRVLLVAPENLPLLDGQFLADSMVDLESIDLERFPLMRDAQVHEVVLAPGEVFFVPVGWWYQIRELEPAIAVTCSNFRFQNDFRGDHNNGSGT